MSRFGEKGEGRAGFLITLVLFLIGVFLVVKIVPVRVEGYQFRDVLREEARYAAVHRDDKGVQQRILDSARSMNIPLDPKNLNIRRTKSEVIITVNYQVPIDLKLTTYTFKVDAEQRAPLF